MTAIPKVYVSGLGAIGSVYAAKFYDIAPEMITVIADRERIDRYTREGIYVNGKAYPFRFVEPEAGDGSADLILIAVKQHHLEESIKAIRNYVGERTVILSLLNGITSEELVGKAYGMEKLLYSFVVGIDALREGTKTNYTRIGRIVFGEKINQDYSPKVKKVKEIFDQAQVPYEIPVDMQRELWWKFMMNVGVNQVSAVLKAPFGVFHRIKEARELMEMASREVIRIAEKLGINLTEEDLQNYIKVLDTLGPQGKTSMLQDVEAGRKTEVEAFAGTVSELGKKHGVATPVNDFLLRAIHTLEQTYQA
ncbi:MAG: ketopantoate reductase family protein [Firmicutes bacterium]|nr:ketopantoate reductase family protein [Bacillota bacterium]